ncbi:MAG: hypothetical protein ACQKBY_05665 [Verrucomicrobiales bacterium]
MKLIKILLSVSVAAGAMSLMSCGCCTGEDPVPPLRPLPPMKEIPIHYGK